MYDGASTAGLLLGVFTGQDSPGELVATSGAMTLVLTSDASISTAGFSAYWRTQVPDPIPPSLSVQTIPSCNAAQVNVNLSDLIDCDWLESATFEVLSSAETFEVTQVESN